MKIILYLLGYLKLLIIKVFHWNSFDMCIKSFVYPSTVIQISRNGHLKFGNNISIRKHVEINVRKNAEVYIGNNCFFNTACIITGHKKILIGNNVEFGPNVYIFDQDHIFKKRYRKREFSCDDIIIGDNVWVGANSVILRGTTIGNNSVIGAGSVIKGKFPENSLIIQKRVSEVKTIERNNC